VGPAYARRALATFRLGPDPQPKPTLPGVFESTGGSVIGGLQG